MTSRPDWEAMLDSPTSAPAWPTVLRGTSGPERVTPARVGGGRKDEEELGMMKGAKLGEEGEGKVRAALEGLTSQLISMEQRLNELDSGSGDGDCGSTLAAGAKAIQVRVKIYIWMKRNEVKARTSLHMGGSELWNLVKLVNMVKLVKLVIKVKLMYSGSTYQMKQRK